MLLLNLKIDQAEFMKKNKPTLRIASDCQRPDPPECSERQNSYAQSGDEICLRCPVASWVTAMVVSGAETNAEADWFEPARRGQKWKIRSLAAVS